VRNFCTLLCFVQEEKKKKTNIIKFYLYPPTLSSLLPFFFLFFKRQPFILVKTCTKALGGIIFKKMQDIYQRGEVVQGNRKFKAWEKKKKRKRVLYHIKSNQIKLWQQGQRD
jgi:hypothetical protein